VADYYSILFKAVSALEPNTASARQRLYERARSAMSAEIEGASRPFDASEIAAAKQGLKSAIDRIEAEALPGWLQQPQRAACANDRPATADLLPDEGACPPFDASEIAAAKQEVERAIGRIEADAAPAWPQQPQGAACANDCPATADLLPEAPCRFLDASEIAAAKEKLERVIERIEAEAIPAWVQPAERAACANDCPTTADLLPDEGASPPVDASEIAVAKQGLKSAIDRIEAEALPGWLQQPQRAALANDCPAAAEVQAEIKEASRPFDASEIDAVRQALKSAIERIEAEAIPDCLQQLERAVCANDGPATAEVPTEIVGAFPPSEIVGAEQGLESAIERFETQAIPDWLRQPERAARADDSPGPIKKLWTRLTGWAPGRQSAPLDRNTWLTDLLERASDEADSDEQNFAPTRAHTQ
jgi:hypothetical protein